MTPEDPAKGVLRVVPGCGYPGSHDAGDGCSSGDSGLRSVSGCNSQPYPVSIPGSSSSCSRAADFNGVPNGEICPAAFGEMKGVCTIERNYLMTKYSDLVLHFTRPGLNHRFVVVNKSILFIRVNHHGLIFHPVFQVRAYGSLSEQVNGMPRASMRSSLIPPRSKILLE